MSLINKMLKDLEDRQESTIKGQDGIISRSKTAPQTSRAPIILLSLLSVMLLATIIYLLWYFQGTQTSPQPRSPAVTETTEQNKNNSNTIASLIKESDDIAPGVEPPPVVAKPKVVQPKVIQPKRIIKPTPTQQLVKAPQPLGKAEGPAPGARAVPETLAEPTPPTTSLSQLIPPELKASWQPQKLIIRGKNFLPDSRVRLCWPAKCVTLKGYRVNFISSNELRITLTTGVKSERWNLTVINPNGSVSNSREFLVTSSALTTSPAQRNAISESSKGDTSRDDATKISKRMIPLTAYQQAEKLYLEASRLEKEHKSAQAITLLEKAILLAPEHHASRKALTEMLLASARVIEAKENVLQAIKLFPNHSIYIRLLAQIHIIQENSQDAITLIEKAINRSVADAELYGLVAALYQSTMETQKSIEHYQRALTLKPDRGVWWMGLGISFEQNSQFSEAISAFQQAQNSGSLSPKLKRYVEDKIALNRKRVEPPQ